MSEVRISDAAAMTRVLDEFRHLDQQERAMAERVAAHISEKEVLEQKKDVEESERSVADRHDENRGAGGGGHHGQRREPEEKKEAPPEVNEGRLLDLKA